MSEQRRALLLPQGVKELGTEEAIIFYEGLRPIRCRKVRYFEDARFQARLLPPPKVSIAPICRETPYTDGVTSSVEGNPSGHADSPPTSRMATVEDLDRIETLNLEDFAVDFSEVEIPATRPGERLSDQAMDAAVEDFLARLKNDRRVQ